MSASVSGRYHPTLESHGGSNLAQCCVLLDSQRHFLHALLTAVQPLRMLTCIACPERLQSSLPVSQDSLCPESMLFAIIGSIHTYVQLPSYRMEVVPLPSPDQKNAHPLTLTKVERRQKCCGRAMSASAWASSARSGVSRTDGRRAPSQ